MGMAKDYLLQVEDYNRLISKTLINIDAVRECPFCHIEYLTGKDKELIYGSVTNAFKKQYYASGYDNKLMKELVKKYLDERCLGHVCKAD